MIPFDCLVWCLPYKIAAEFEAQASALKSHYEGRLGQLQRELDSRPVQSDTNGENTAELDKLRKENAEVVQKVCVCVMH